MLTDRTSCNDENILYLPCVLAISEYEALEMCLLNNYMANVYHFGHHSSREVIMQIAQANAEDEKNGKHGVCIKDKRKWSTEGGIDLIRQ